MSLLAEEIVEEWLNRQGFFTIRGAKTGVEEIDILAVRPTKAKLECRHLEVQASSNPVSFLTPATKAARKGGLAPYSQKPRTPAFMRECVDEWVEKKYSSKKKTALRARLVPGGDWQLELVVHRVKFAEELKYVRKQKIRVHRLDEIVEELLAGAHDIKAAAGASLIELIASLR